MLSEVIERINLIISVAGSREISFENLTFLFDKYELTDADKKAVMEYCEKRQIRIFREEALPVMEKPEPKVEKELKEAASVKKESLFGRLFKKK